MIGREETEGGESVVEKRKRETVSEVERGQGGTNRAVGSILTSVELFQG